ncbi:MAG: radical SAM protein [Candidatus Lokiarchaeota archaeon]|nr:radical SAM protein [Candidatus Lokiarchaeota archaeon]
MYGIHTMKQLTIELTHKCKLNCIHCSSSYIKSELTLDDIREILDRYNIDKIVLSGGEPLSHPQFDKILLYLTSRYKISLNTCGVNLSSGIRFIDDIKLDLLHNFNKIYVSIYSDEKIHNEITRSKSFKDTVQFFTLARVLFSQLHRDSNDIIINTPVFSALQVKKLVDLFSVYKYYYNEEDYLRRLDYKIHFIRLIPHGRAENISILSRRKQLEIAHKYKKEFPNNILISNSLSHKKCNAKNKLTLLPDKKLIHCVAGKHLEGEEKVNYICDLV